MKNRTTFIIAHRLSTIKNANKIVVLKEGRVAQIGHHDDLIDQQGLYRELYDPDWAKEQKRLRDLRIEELALAALGADVTDPRPQSSTTRASALT